MAAKGHWLSLGIGVTYLLFKSHDIWWKTELALNLQVSTYSVLYLPIVQCPRSKEGKVERVFYVDGFSLTAGCVRGKV